MKTTNRLGLISYTEPTAQELAAFEQFLASAPKKTSFRTVILDFIKSLFQTICNWTVKPLYERLISPIIHYESIDATTAKVDRVASEEFQPVIP